MVIVEFHHRQGSGQRLGHGGDIVHGAIIDGESSVVSLITKVTVKNHIPMIEGHNLASRDDMFVDTALHHRVNSVIRFKRQSTILRSDILSRNALIHKENRRKDNKNQPFKHNLSNIGKDKGLEWEMVDDS